MKIATIFTFSYIIFHFMTSPLLSNTYFKIELSKDTLKQGDILHVRVLTNQPLRSGTVKLGKHRYQLFKKKGLFRAYIGIPSQIKPGKTNLIFNFKKADNTNYSKTAFIDIKKEDYRKEVLYFLPKKANLIKKKSTLGKENRILKPYLKKITSKKFFTKNFILPAKGRISSPFGAFRVKIDKKTDKQISRSSPHSGLDIANKIGTPIIAANNGKVIFSKSLKSHGETIIINHGMGIISIYLHLNKRLAKTGELVRKGKMVGLMGKTGIATGPHVHWGVYVQGVKINPLTLMNI